MFFFHFPQQKKNKMNKRTEFFPYRKGIAEFMQSLIWELGI